MRIGDKLLSYSNIGYYMPRNFNIDKFTHGEKGMMVKHEPFVTLTYRGLNGIQVTTVAEVIRRIILLQDNSAIIYTNVFAYLYIGRKSISEVKQLDHIVFNVLGEIK